MKRHVLGWLGALVCLAFALGGLWIYDGAYGLHVLLRNGGIFWVAVKSDDPRLSDSMRLALGSSPEATPGPFEWRPIAEGFEVGELPALVGANEVDRIMLARVDPARFRFEVHNAPAGDRDLDRWMGDLGATLVINGSYYARYGIPATPILNGGLPLGPKVYNARAGAFISSSAFTGIRDLSGEDWRTVFNGADDAMVSYPLLLAGDGTTRVPSDSQWLATRSFVGQDKQGWIVFGTTMDGFFALNRLATFLQRAPLALNFALNLDGGPVACQGISFNGYERRIHGKWEMQTHNGHVKLLTWSYGTIAMPVVLAVFPK